MLLIIQSRIQHFLRSLASWLTEDEEITIPHPELTKRLFVLEPLCELTPRGIHPLERRRYSDILEDLKEKEK